MERWRKVKRCSNNSMSVISFTFFYRNPHIQDVANIQEAAVVYHPEQPEQLALFLFETYYPITNDLLIFFKRDGG